MRTGDLLLVAVTALAVAAGCSDEHAGSLPTSSPTPFASSASPTASATASAAPGPVAAAVAYYTTLEGAARSPEQGAGRLARLVAPGCDCHQVVDLLHRLAGEKHHLEFTVRTSTARVARETGTDAAVFLHVEQTAGREVDAAGRTVRPLPATSGDYVLTLVRGNGGWLVRQIGRSQ